MNYELDYREVNVEINICDRIFPKFTPTISGKTLHFEWDNMLVSATISPYYFPHLSPREHRDDLSYLPIVKREVIDPGVQMVSASLEGIRDLIPELEKLAEEEVTNSNFAFSKMPISVDDKPMHPMFMVYDQSRSEQRQKRLFERVFLYKGVDKSIVPGNEDLVDLARDIHPVEGMNFLGIRSLSLKYATEAALKVYKMHERLRKGE